MMVDGVRVAGLAAAADHKGMEWIDPSTKILESLACIADLVSALGKSGI